MEQTSKKQQPGNITNKKKQKEAQLNVAEFLAGAGKKKIRNKNKAKTFSRKAERKQKKMD